MLPKSKTDGKAVVDGWAAYANLRIIASLDMLRLVGGPTQPRSGIWATRPNAPWKAGDQESGSRQREANQAGSS